jgi:tRNA 2-selenouridine synthase
MAINKIEWADALALLPNALCIDVRSPDEYTQGHVPGAISMPLFNNEERKVVGTAYKQESRKKAIKIGLEYFGPKMPAMVTQIEAQLQENQKEIIVHCWRGGMRSAAIAWLLDLYGFKVNVVIGGYKAFRNWVLLQFESQYKFNILAGNTGSNKTVWLHYLKNKGHAIIDLEGLANHKGSTFGHLGMPPQPSQEHFENKLALELFNKANNTIWLEDESKRIGLVNLPEALWKTMRSMPIYFLNVTFEKRLQIIIDGYSKHNLTEIIDAIVRITKRLGGLEAKNAIAFAEAGDFENCFSILLKYYDKYYLKGLMARENYKELLINIEESFLETL